MKKRRRLPTSEWSQGARSVDCEEAECLCEYESSNGEDVAIELCISCYLVCRKMDHYKDPRDELTYLCFGKRQFVANFLVHVYADDALAVELVVTLDEHRVCPWTSTMRDAARIYQAGRWPVAEIEADLNWRLDALSDSFEYPEIEE